MIPTHPPDPPSPQYWRDRRWIHDHLAELCDEYDGRWIAAHCGEVLAADADLGVVEDAARSRCSARDTVFQYIDCSSILVVTL